MSDLQPINRGASPGSNIPLPGIGNNEDNNDANTQTPASTTEALMSQVLQQLKIMNLHLSFITDVWLNEQEVKNG